AALSLRDALPIYPDLGACVVHPTGVLYHFSAAVVVDTPSKSVGGQHSIRKELAVRITDADHHLRLMHLVDGFFVDDPPAVELAFREVKAHPLRHVVYRRENGSASAECIVIAPTDWSDLPIDPGM